MKKNITKEEEKALLEIAKRLMAAVDSRASRKQWKEPTCWDG